MSLSYEQIAGNDGVSMFTFTARDIYAGVIHEFSLQGKAEKVIERIVDLCQYDFERFGGTSYARNFLCYDNLVEWLTNNILPLPEIQGIGLRHAEFDAFIRDLADTLIRSRIRIDYSTFPNAIRHRG